MSFNITGRWIKIWKVEVKEKMVVCDVSTSDKQHDGTYKNSNYYGVKFVGKCFDDAKSLNKGDSIEIINGKIGKREWEKKYFDDVVVFAFKLEEGKSNDSGFTPVDDPDINNGLPF